MVESIKLQSIQDQKCVSCVGYTIKHVWLENTSKQELEGEHIQTGLLEGEQKKEIIRANHPTRIS